MVVLATSQGAQGQGDVKSPFDPIPNVALWPQQNGWEKAIEIKTRVACEFKQYRKCTLSVVIAEADNADKNSKEKCQRFCELAASTDSDYGVGKDFTCQWDETKKECEKCDDKSLFETNFSNNANFFSGSCREHHDFAYSSPVWNTASSDFTDNELPLHGENKIYKAYDSLLVTHVKVEVGTKTIEMAVYPFRQGKHTLRELVTASGGSIASEISSNGVDNWRGKAVPFGSGAKHCEHFGFNYLNIAGRNEVQTGRHYAYDYARARIGTVAGNQFPCDRNGRHSAFGVGLDARHNRASFRLSSGYLGGGVVPAENAFKTA